MFEKGLKKGDRLVFTIRKEDTTRSLGLTLSETSHSKLSHSFSDSFSTLSMSKHCDCLTFVIYCLSSSGKYLQVLKKCCDGRHACLHKTQLLVWLLSLSTGFLKGLERVLSLKNAFNTFSSAAECISSYKVSIACEISGFNDASVCDRRSVPY